jgi:uncharacterized protein (TIGR02284 family)
MLQDLIETRKEGERGFALAERDSREPALTGVFREYTESCQAAVVELQDEVRRLGGAGGVPARMQVPPYRGWIRANAVAISRGSKAILEECERGEDYARALYAEALTLDLPGPVRSIMERQQQSVLAAHGRIRALRNNQRSDEIVVQPARSR